VATATVTEEAVESELKLSPEAAAEAWAQILRADAVVDDDDTIRTTADLVKQSKRSASTMRGLMREMIEAGKVERVRVRRMSTDGKWQPVPAYRLVVGEWITDDRN